MNNCQECGIAIAIDERIRHNNKIICGHCFVKMPKENKSFVDVPGEQEVNQAEAILQLMQMAVEQDERIKLLEEKIAGWCSSNITRS